MSKAVESLLSQKQQASKLRIDYQAGIKGHPQQQAGGAAD
jgi:hypothetical protein